jgi:hypothetical protein
MMGSTFAVRIWTSAVQVWGMLATITEMREGSLGESQSPAVLLLGGSAVGCRGT